MEEGVGLKWNDKSDKSETEYVIMDKWTRSEVFEKKNVNVPQQQICPNGIIRKRLREHLIWSHHEEEEEGEWAGRERSYLSVPVHPN